jgi:hypothetical protein
VEIENVNIGRPPPATPLDRFLAMGRPKHVFSKYLLRLALCDWSATKLLRNANPFADICAMQCAMQVHADDPADCDMAKFKLIARLFGLNQSQPVEELS